MLKIKLAIIVFILLNCLSCSRNNLAQDNPDAAVCNIRGELFYNSAYERWEIHSSASDEVVELYVVRNYWPKEAGNFKKVQATGICTQSNEISYTLHDNLPPIPEFICYYIDVKYLKYE